MRLRLPGLVVLSTLVFAATAPEFAFAQPAPSSPGGAMLTSSTAWTVPRTPWGHPDLEGVWATDTITPFERPVDLAGKGFFPSKRPRSSSGRRWRGPTATGATGVATRTWPARRTTSGGIAEPGSWRPAAHRSWSIRPKGTYRR